MTISYHRRPGPVTYWLTILWTQPVWIKATSDLLWFIDWAYPVDRSSEVKQCFYSLGCDWTADQNKQNRWQEFREKTNIYQYRIWSNKRFVKTMLMKNWKGLRTIDEGKLWDHSLTGSNLRVNEWSKQWDCSGTWRYLKRGAQVWIELKSEKRPWTVASDDQSYCQITHCPKV